MKENGAEKSSSGEDKCYQSDSRFCLGSFFS